MNKTSNLFNSSPLGSGESSSKIYVKAQLICRATYSAVITVGRRLKATAVSAAQTTATLRAGRPLKSSIEASAANTTAILHAMHPVAMSANQDASASIVANLSKRTRKYLSATVDASASIVAHIRRALPMRIVLNAVASVTAYLNESSRTRAPEDRIIYIPNQSRTVIVPKGKV